MSNKIPVLKNITSWNLHWVRPDQVQKHLRSLHAVISCICLPLVDGNSLMTHLKYNHHYWKSSYEDLFLDLCALSLENDYKHAALYFVKTISVSEVRSLPSPTQAVIATTASGLQTTSDRSPTTNNNCGFRLTLLRIAIFQRYVDYYFQVLIFFKNVYFQGLCVVCEHC